MAARRSPLVLIFITVFLDLVGFGIVIPILPLYAERFGASPLVIGCLLGVYSAMQCLAAPLLGKLSDRIGRRPVLFVSLLGSAAGFLIMGLAHSLPLVFLGRMIDGITGGNISTAQAYIADVTPPEQRSRGMGLIGAAFGLGFIFGPAIGGVLGHYSLATPLLFAAALAAANALGVLFLLPESLTSELRAHPRAKLPVSEVFHHARRRQLSLIITAYFVTTVSFSLLTATYPLFTERRFGYGAIQNGGLFAMQGILAAIVQGLLLGWLVKRAGEKRLAIAGALVLIFSMFTLPTSTTTTMLFIATAGLATGHGLVAAPLNSMASQSVDAFAQGRVLGLMQSAASLARIVGPVLGGSLLQYDAVHVNTAHFGQTAYWTSGAIVLAALTLILAL